MLSVRTLALVSPFQVIGMTMVVDVEMDGNGVFQ